MHQQWGVFYDTFLKLVFRTGNFCSGLSNSQKVTSMGVQAVPWGGSSWHHVRMFFLSRILCFECVCRFICVRVWDLRSVEEQLYQIFCISFLFKTHTQAKTKHFKYWCGSCDAFGAVGVSRFYVRQLQPIAKRTFSTPIRNIPDHITGKLPPEPQKTLHNR